MTQGPGGYWEVSIRFMTQDLEGLLWSYSAVSTQYIESYFKHKKGFIYTTSQTLKNDNI